MRHSLAYLLQSAIAVGQDAADVLELCISADVGLDEKVHQQAAGVQELGGGGSPEGAHQANTQMEVGLHLSFAAAVF